MNSNPKYNSFNVWDKRGANVVFLLKSGEKTRSTGPTDPEGGQMKYYRHLNNFLKKNQGLQFLIEFKYFFVKIGPFQSKLITNKEFQKT